MAHRHRLVYALGLIITGLPLAAEAVQITPNPNPAGSTINIVNDPTAFNALNPFTNEGVINIDNTSTLTNSGTLTNRTTDVLTGNISNFGTLTNSGTLTLQGIGGAPGLFSDLENHGTFNNSGLVSDLGNAILQNHGTMTNSGTIDSPSGILTQTGSQLINTSTGVINVSTLSNVGGTFTNAGSLSNIFNPAGGIFNNGTMTNAAGSTVTIIGSPTPSGAGNWNTGRGATTINEASSTQTIDELGKVMNTGTFTHAGLMTNNGTITNGDTPQPPSATFINTGSIVGTGTYTQLAGQTINNGMLTQSGSGVVEVFNLNDPFSPPTPTSVTGVTILGGSLSGLGTINAPLTIASGASLNPGTDTQLGTFTLNGNLASSGNLNFRLGGLNAGDFDVLKINGNVAFTGGTLRFDFVNGFTAAVGNSWKFLYATALSGWDRLLVSVNGLAAGLGYEITSANGAQTLTITGGPISVPEPSSCLLLGLGLAGLIGLRRKLL